MHPIRTLWYKVIPVHASVVLAAAMLTACGGGDSGLRSADAGAAELARQIAKSAESAAPTAPSDRKRALAATPNSIQATLNWAEWKYASLFPKGPVSFPLVYLDVPYTVRGYTTGNYLGITATGDIYGLGPFTNQVLTAFGNLADYAAAVQADTCQVDPASCPSPLDFGLNECADPMWATLPAGHRVTALYDVTYAVGRFEMSVDYQVVGAATFQGIAATQVSQTSVSRLASSNPGTALGQFSELKIDGFMTPLTNGFWQELGDRTLNREGSGPSGQSGPSQFEIVTQTINDPPVPTLQFGLRIGQSVTLNTRKTTAVLQPAGQPPFTIPSSVTHTFERRETITVGGKTYDTCRYREAEAGVAEITTSWYIVGRGVAALIESRSANEVASFQLKSGTYRGTPF